MRCKYCNNKISIIEYLLSWGRKCQFCDWQESAEAYRMCEKRSDEYWEKKKGEKK